MTTIYAGSKTRYGLLRRTYETIIKQLRQSCPELGSSERRRVIGYLSISALAVTTQTLAAKAASQKLASGPLQTSASPGGAVSMVTDLSLTESLLAMTWKHSLVVNSDNDGAVGTTKGLAGKAVRLSAMFALARLLRLSFARLNGLNINTPQINSNCCILQARTSMLFTPANLVNFASAVAAMAFSVYEYLRPQGWPGNVLALALAIYEVACQSSGRICYAIVSLCLTWSLDFIREMSPLIHVKELLVYLGLVASHGGISVNVPIKLCEGSVEHARLYFEQFTAPGVFIAMALKYDRFKRATGRSSSKLSPYFGTALAGYACGLACTYLAQWTSKMTRQGVIFIAPATVLPVLSLAYAKGELWRFWLFDEDEWDNLTLKFDTEDDFAFSLH